MNHEDWFWEGNVQQRVAAHFVAAGWELVSAADTASRQTGVDLVLQRAEERLNVEVKGWPSTKYARGPKAGHTKPTAPTLQARHWFAEAALSAMLLRERLSRGPWKLRWGSSARSASCETLRETAKSHGRTPNDRFAHAHVR